MSFMPPIKKNVTLPSSVAARIDELAERFVNRKGHGQVVTASVIAFELLSEKQQRAMILAARKIEIEDRSVSPRLRLDESENLIDGFDEPSRAPGSKSSGGGKGKVKRQDKGSKSGC